MPSRIHTVCIRLARLSDRCRTMPRVDGEKGDFAGESFLLIDKHDAQCLEEAVQMLTEYESMRVDRTNSATRFAGKPKFGAKK